MQTDISKEIDVLAEMAAETSGNIDTLEAELNEIEREMTRLKNELYQMENFSDEKYFKASDKQVDENIKVSLEAKIKKQEESISDLELEIKSVCEDEKNLHESIKKIREDVSDCDSYIDSLNDRMTFLADSTILENYKMILNEQNQKIDTLVSSLNQKEKEYDTVLEKLNYLTLAKEEMEEKLKYNKERLTDIKTSLANPSSYLDKDLKDLDSKRIEEIKKQIQEYDKRRIEIITDPLMIAKEAKDLIDEDDRTSALSKIKELVTLAKSKPFMDLPNSQDAASVLENELEAAINERDEFASIIDQKDYTVFDSNVLGDRIEYLQIQIASYEEKIKQLKEEIHKMDSNDFVTLSEYLKKAVEQTSELEKNIEVYKEVMNSDEEKTPRRKAVLAAAFDKKNHDLEIMQAIIKQYQNEQKDMIERAHEIEVTKIQKYEQLMSDLKSEMDGLNKLLSVRSKAKDVLAIESDKKQLKELDDKVKSIQHRQKYNLTPNEIYDEIEIYLSSLDEEPAVENSEDHVPEQEDIESTLNYDYDVPNVHLEDEILDEPDYFDKMDAVLPVSDVMDELPELPNDNAIDGLEDRLKVVHVEPIGDSPKIEEEENDSENPFLIADYQDDDYIDVEHLFDTDGVL